MGDFEDVIQLVSLYRIITIKKTTWSSTDLVIPKRSPKKIENEIFKYLPEKEVE